MPDQIPDQTPDHTVRYWAPSRLTYARALYALVNYARKPGEEFTFGPLDISALEHTGLAVSGPELSGVRQVLGEIPGLTEEPA